MFCILSVAKEETIAQYQTEAHSDWSEQQRCIEDHRTKKVLPIVGVPGAQELDLDLYLGKYVVMLRVCVLRLILLP